MFASLGNSAALYVNANAVATSVDRVTFRLQINGQTGHPIDFQFHCVETDQIRVEVILNSPWAIEMAQLQIHFNPSIFVYESFERNEGMHARVTYVYDYIDAENGLMAIGMVRNVSSPQIDAGQHLLGYIVFSINPDIKYDLEDMLDTSPLQTYTTQMTVQIQDGHLPNYATSMVVTPEGQRFSGVDHIVAQNLTIGLLDSTERCGICGEVVDDCECVAVRPPWPEDRVPLPPRPENWTRGMDWPEDFRYEPPAGWTQGDPWPGDTESTWPGDNGGGEPNGGGFFRRENLSWIIIGGVVLLAVAIFIGNKVYQRFSGDDDDDEDDEDEVVAVKQEVKPTTPSEEKPIRKRATTPKPKPAVSTDSAT